MFGADTHLIMDALQMAGLAAVATGAAVWIFLRHRHSESGGVSTKSSDNLEDRVRVLERIATDRSIDLAEEIEGLRGAEKQKEAS